MHQEILKFWFEDIDEARWWHKDAEFDKLIRNRFSVLHRAAACCELFEWRQTAEGRLAEIIILDQFSRNMFRGSSLSFLHDHLALALSQEAISKGADNELDPTKRSFLYMPFMHSESLKIHEVAICLFQANGLQSNLNSEIRHKRIIEQFGRYPHRNGILGRESAKEEVDFLKLPGSSF